MSSHAWTIAITIATLCACGSSVESNQGSGGAATSNAAGDGVSTSTTTTTTTSAVSSSASGSGGGGGCQTDAECPGGTCIELAPGGYRVCAHFPAEATSCTMPPPPISDQCCTSADCMSGGCYKSNDLPYCGGAPMPDYNLCIADQCQTDDDCIHDNPTPWICYPSGAFGYPARTCRTAYCRTDADCTAQTGGACVPIEDPCCSIPYGLACVYPGGCSKDSDCAPDGSQHCAIDPMTGASACSDGPVGCPG